MLRKVTPGTRSGSPQLHSSSECGSQEEKTCPNHYPRDRWEVGTKNYFILLWGPFYTHSSFLHVFVSLCCDSSLSPNGSVHFPHLSEGGQQVKIHDVLRSDWVLPRFTCSQSNRSRGPLIPASTRLQHLSQCLPTAWRLPFPTRLKLHEDRRALTLFTVESPVHSSESFLSGILSKYTVDIKSASSQWCNQGQFSLPGDIWQSLGTFLVLTTREEGGKEWYCHLVGRGQRCY